MKKNLMVLLALLILPFSMTGQEKARMSLQDAVNFALEHNLSLKNAQINIADAKEQIVERRAIGIPQLSAGVNYQYYIDIPTQIFPDFISPAVYGVLFDENLLEERTIDAGGGLPAQFGTKHNLTAGIELNTMILDGTYFIGLKAARLYKQYVQQELVASQSDVRIQVIEAYLPSLILEESIQTLDKNIANLEKLLFETREMYKEGFVELLDVDRLELSLANLKTERDNLHRQKSMALNGLKFVLGYPIGQELEVTDNIQSLLVEAADDMLSGEVNYFSRPEYGVATLGEQLTELNVRFNRAAYYPTLYGFGSYQQSLYANKLSEGEWFPSTVLGVQLNVPIFDGLNKKAKVQRALLSLEIARNQKAELEQVISLEVQNAQTSYISARERLESQKRNIALAQRIYDTTQIKYREGVGSSLEVTSAEQSLYESQQNYNQAIYDLLVAKANLEKALGR